MTSYLLIAKPQETAKPYLEDFFATHNINTFDQYWIDKETAETSKKSTKKTAPKLSLGIDNIKFFKEKLSLKPFKSKEKAGIISDSETLTIEAQNSLLKILEEPPLNTYIFLISENLEALLPTIQSRCQIITFQPSTEPMTREEQEDFSNTIDLLPKKNTSEILALAQKVGTSKDQAITWIEKAILIERTNLRTNLEIKGDSAKSFQTIRILSEARTILHTTNTNPRLVMEHALLELITYNL